MKVAGFTFIRNAIKYDYPVVESIKSILPLCDVVFVAVGDSEDGTRELIASIHPQKVKIVDTIWDDSLREGGHVLAIETDKALAQISDEFDWAFYIQGDEVIHEMDLEKIRNKLEIFNNNSKVDGLLFDYLHFYGSYDYIANASSWYNHEVRVIRPGKGIYSYKDAQGFRKNGNLKLNVKKAEASIHHYGYVRDPRAMQRKQTDFNKYWHDDAWIEDNIAKADVFDYSGINTLKKYTGSHPEIMKARINQLNWRFDFDISRSKLSLKDHVKKIAYNNFGWDWNYQNYKLI